MMKNKIFIIVLVGVLLVSCIVLGGIIAFNNDVKKQVNDNNDKLLLTCESGEIRLNEDVKCTLKGNITEYDVSSVSAKIEKSSIFKVNEVTVDPSWQGDGEEGFIAVYTDENKSNIFDIATFTISLVDDSTGEVNINLVDIILSDENYEDHNLDNVIKTLKVGK